MSDQQNQPESARLAAYRQKLHAAGHRYDGAGQRYQGPERGERIRLWQDVENELHDAVVMVKGRVSGPIAERVAITLEVVRHWIGDVASVDVSLADDGRAAVADSMIQQLIRDIVTETAAGWAPAYLAAVETAPAEPEPAPSRKEDVSGEY